MNVFLMKFLCIPGILLVNVIAGLLPYCLVDHRRKLQKKKINRFPPNQFESNENTCLSGSSFHLSQFLSMANCYAAGIFLATCFVGLLPSVGLKYKNLMKLMSNSTSHPSSHEASHSDHDVYPLPEASICLGFFLVWGVELLIRAVMTCCRRRKYKKLKNYHRFVPTDQDSSNSIVSNDKQIEEQFSLSSDQSNDLDNVGIGSREKLIPSHENEFETLLNPSSKREQTILLKSILLTIALSSHSILEGIGFGLLDHASQVFNMALAMLLHESLCAFSLGVRLASGTPRGASLIMLVVFSSLIPIGIGVGLVLHQEASSSVFGQLVSMLLQGMAAGTFLYVVFLEILPSELQLGGHESHAHFVSPDTMESETDTHSSTTKESSNKTESGKLLFCILGFLSISLLRLYHAH